ncbi:MAG: hypothetical protein AAF492_29490, partial [Verrucomicrobiota bacterium]
QKNTAMTVEPESGVDPVTAIEELCASSSKLLERWPEIRTAWDDYLDRDLRPALQKHIDCLS